MSNKLAEISKVEDSKVGVDVHLTGDVQRGTVERMLEECDPETCCGPELFEQISDISVSGQDGDTTIHVIGDVTSEMVEPKLAACDCYDKQIAVEKAKDSGSD